MALRYTTSPQEREAGTRPRALVLGQGVPGRRYRVPMASCEVLGRRYGVPLASYDVLARRYGVPTAPCSVPALHRRPRMIRTLYDPFGTAFRSLERPESGARFSFWRRN